ncbi:hypothetical protein IEQ34_012467 [Dendrobium chrysotoxum]|uniref:Uncharacterized protein n=1 Tax=Dendrobium chrysotoxum TaxID=161865 RepID=A0AAV7GVB5_DENCH|nr:hypothetical protein IEQ34_012467 [Dendrobium chrysotoxum]
MPQTPTGILVVSNPLTTTPPSEPPRRPLRCEPEPPPHCPVLRRTGSAHPAHTCNHPCISRPNPGPATGPRCCREPPTPCDCRLRPQKHQIRRPQITPPFLRSSSRQHHPMTIPPIVPLPLCRRRQQKTVFSLPLR